MGNLTPCKIVTPKNIILKLCTRDYVGEVTHHANVGFNQECGGFSQIGDFVTFLTVLSNSRPETRKFSNPEIPGFSRTQSRDFGINKIYLFNCLFSTF